MKYIKWKSLIITSLVCLSPIFLGIALWDSLPETIAIHFNINNEPDNFASKEFAVFGLPVLMMLMQIFCCVVNDIAVKNQKNIKFEKVAKWFLPVMSIILQTITLGYSLGWNIDIRKSVIVIIGILFLISGISLTKLDYIKNHDISPEKARKINKFSGIGAAIMGIIALITIFLPPIFTLIWLFLLIPYTIISIIYGIKVTKSV